ncbi:MAG: hypothetical protein ACLTYN_05270 [Dysosmobacter welbionis]
MLKGDYYRMRNGSALLSRRRGGVSRRSGHLGIVEAVKADGKLIFVELNEITAPPITTTCTRASQAPLQLQLLAVHEAPDAEGRLRADHGYAVRSSRCWRNRA